MYTHTIYMNGNIANLYTGQIVQYVPGNKFFMGLVISSCYMFNEGVSHRWD